MKTLISESGTYKVFVEIRDANASQSVDYQLRLLSTLDSAKDPNGEKVLAELILSPEELQNFAAAIMTHVISH